eukprot:3677288-Amphidinium_carterae.1
MCIQPRSFVKPPPPIAKFDHGLNRRPCGYGELSRRGHTRCHLDLGTLAVLASYTKCSTPCSDQLTGQ